VNRTLGTILVVVGLLGLAWGGLAKQDRRPWLGVTYATTEKVNIGPFHTTRKKTHIIPAQAIFGAVALIGGVVLLVAGKKTYLRTATAGAPRS
jgi:hypothetical protein